MQTVKSSDLDCPVDFVSVNENKVRVTAFLVLLTILAFIFTMHPVFPVVLAIDFFLRAFQLGKFSPLAYTSEKIGVLLKLPFKATDQAPKRFAAKIGLVFSVAILVFYFLGWHILLISVVLAVFASLESLAGFCAGCYVYTFLKLFAKKNNQ
ncbi:MAG: DUF4395 domain-containing protein [Verrucomicrobia bacterium]|nr:DUF4395 domain-containing protein [Cytophagales bacterium]